MSTEPSAAAFCADEVRAHDFERYAATLFVGPAQRRALLALEAFSGEIARVRDHISQPLPGEIRLQWWIDTLTGTAHGGVEGHPIAAELLQAVATFGLPVDDLVGLIEAHRFDLYDDPMPDMDALEAYLGATAGRVFALGARICAPQAAAPGELSRHAGLAQGLVRIIGLLPLHASRRQLYLPQQVLDLNGAGIEDIFSGTATPQLRTVLAYLGREARTHLDAALAVLASAPPALRPAFLPLALVRKSLQRIEQGEFDPFRPRPASRLAVLWTLWRESRSAPFRG
ncbi:phytoene/squalene synthase family protein [Bradyrhizobium prioriisuperbiae]|uniref:phytoene/squalene synthase family protein n=1 Tax=Bradyrhizobium prioriisuperbiae TaxID=2854389 RepID=UPI0028E386A5|nr:phytoene/squalene synthase family protein [Bradyrhizobium prioritasuperba]